jgi:anti-anti-sigma factor
MADIGTVRIFRPDPTAVEKPEQRGRASYAIKSLTPNLSVIVVSGEIDATNGRDLGRYVERHTATSTQLIVDCSAVEFFGSQGFGALHYMSVSCSRIDVDWVIVPGREVRRMLRICDPHGELPLADSVESARARLDRLARRLSPISWAG